MSPRTSPPRPARPGGPTPEALRRRAAAATVIPATAPSSVWALVRGSDDSTVDAAIDLVRAAVGDVVSAQVRRVAGEPGAPPVRDPIVRTTVTLEYRVGRDARARLLGVLAAAMCVAVRIDGRRARLTGRRSDIARVLMLHIAVDPVAGRVLAEDVTRSQRPARRPSAGCSAAERRAWQMAEFTVDVQEWMRVAASQAAHRAGAGAGAAAALRHRWAAAQRAAAIDSGEQPPATPPTPGPAPAGTASGAAARAPGRGVAR